MRPIAWTHLREARWSAATLAMMCSRYRALPRHPNKWRGWPRALTSSFIQHRILSWGRTEAADFLRLPFIVKAALLILALWQSGSERSTSCSHILPPRSERCDTIAGTFQADR